MHKHISRLSKFTAPLLVVGLVVFGFALVTQAADAASTTFLVPTDYDGYHNDWSNADRAFTSNNQYTSDNDEDDDQSYEDFNFGIPSNATINGIQVKVEGKSSDSSGCQLETRMYNKNSSSHSNYINQALTGSDTTYTLGSASNLWGKSWVPSDFSNANFHLEFRFDDISSSSCDDADVYVDLVAVNVHYTVPVCGDGLVNQTKEQCDGQEGCIMEGEDQCTWEPAYINVAKVVCDDEADLPNWGDGGDNITSSTAADYIASHEGCVMGDWSFQWAPDGTANPGDNDGIVGGSWSAPFGGIAEVEAPVSKVWVREVAHPDYVPFSSDTTPPQDDEDGAVSAEFYCSTDVLNYDNYDWIANLQPGQNYYCVGFNVLAKGNLMVHKQVDTDADGEYDVTEDSEANTLLDPTGWNLNNEDPWNAWGDEKTLSVGSHEVVENPTEGYHLAGWTYGSPDGDMCGDAKLNDMPINVEVNSGETTHITLCNTRDTYNIRTFKWVDPANDEPYAYEGDEWTWGVNEETGISNNDDRWVITGTDHDVTETADVFPEADYTATWECFVGEGEEIGSGEGRSFSTDDLTFAPENGDYVFCQFLNTEIERYDVHGYKWHDLNGNGIRDCENQSDFNFTTQIQSDLVFLPRQCETYSEELLSGWTIFLDENDDGLLNGEEQSTVTKNFDGEDGWYIFNDLPAGDYRICEVQQTGWEQTYPASCHSITLPNDDLRTQNGVYAPEYNFGNRLATDLSISKTVVVNGVASATANEGDKLTYAITVKNEGEAAANNLYIEDTTPTNTTLVPNWGGDLGNPVINGSNFTWGSFNLAGGATVTVAFEVTVNAGLPIGTTLIENTAKLYEAPAVEEVSVEFFNRLLGIHQANAAEPTWVLIANSNLVLTTVTKAAPPVVRTPIVLGEEALPGLTVEKTVGSAFTNPGGTVTYTVVVTNNGDALAEGVTLIDTLPDGLHYTDTLAMDHAWIIGDLAVDASKTITYQVKVNANALEGNYINTAVAWAAGVDNVADTATLEVRKPAVLGAEDLPVTGAGFITLAISALTGFGAVVLSNRKQK